MLNLNVVHYIVIIYNYFSLKKCFPTYFHEDVHLKFLGVAYTVLSFNVTISIGFSTIFFIILRMFHCMVSLQRIFIKDNFPVVIKVIFICMILFT
jgi:hypothetical protein